jgi:hypothetical protein
VRATWQTYRAADTAVVFVLGTRGLATAQLEALYSEHAALGDLALLSDITDSYAGLTSKMLAMFAWTVREFTFSYLLKVCTGLGAHGPAQLL